MRKTLFLLLLSILITLIIFFIVATTEAEAQTVQNTRRHDIWSGSWDTFAAVQDSNTAENDTIWFNYNVGSDSVFYTEAFKVWPFMDIFATVVDSFTVDRDSVKFIVRFLQSGESFDTTAASQFVRVKNLSWKSTSSHTEADTLTAVGYYAANITEEPIYVARWGRLAVECFEDNGCRTGNYIFLTITGWNNFK